VPVAIIQRNHLHTSAMVVTTMQHTALAIKQILVQVVTPIVNRMPLSLHQPTHTMQHMVTAMIQQDVQVAIPILNQMQHLLTVHIPVVIAINATDRQVVLPVGQLLNQIAVYSLTIANTIIYTATAMIQQDVRADTRIVNKVPLITIPITQVIATTATEHTVVLPAGLAALRQVIHQYSIILLQLMVPQASTATK